MGDKAKNIISNLLGLLALVAALIQYFMFELSTEKFVVGVLVSLMLFLFKVTQTRGFIKKIINKKTE